MKISFIELKKDKPCHPYCERQSNQHITFNHKIKKHKYAGKKNETHIFFLSKKECTDCYEMEWFADDFRIETQVGQDKGFGIIFLLFYERGTSNMAFPRQVIFGG